MKGINGNKLWVKMWHLCGINCDVLDGFLMDGLGAFNMHPQMLIEIGKRGSAGHWPCPLIFSKRQFGKIYMSFAPCIMYLK